MRAKRLLFVFENLSAASGAETSRIKQAMKMWPVSGQPQHTETVTTEPARLLNPHRLAVHEFANAKVAQFPSITGILDTAKRQTRIGSNHAVDED